MAGCMVGMHAKRTIFWNIDGFYDGLFAWLDELKGRGVVGRPWETLMSRVSTLDELTALLR
jgi:predicted Rossmann-fold nucleotide-binding protein